MHPNPAWSARGSRPRIPKGKRPNSFRGFLPSESNRSESCACTLRIDSRLTGVNHLSVLTFHSPLLRKTPLCSSPLPRNMLKLDRSLSDTVRISTCLALQPSSRTARTPAHFPCEGTPLAKEEVFPPFLGVREIPLASIHARGAHSSSCRWMCATH